MFNRKTALRGSAVVAVALAFTLSMTGCSAIQDILGGDSATRDEDTNEVVEGGDADVFTDLNVGDCFNNEGGDAISELPVVPCDELHDNQIFALIDLEDGDFPGDAEIETQADAACLAAFEPWVGIAYDASALYIGYITPSAESWASGDREVICAVSDEDQITGSLEGAAR